MSPRDEIEPSDAQEVCRQLREVLADVEAGRLVCSAATRHRIEGAVIALKTTERIEGPDEVYVAPARRADAP